MSGFCKQPTFIFNIRIQGEEEINEGLNMVLTEALSGAVFYISPPLNNLYIGKHKDNITRPLVCH